MTLLRALMVLVCLGSSTVEAKDLTPREIYERASPAVVMVMGHPEHGTTGSGGTGSIIQADGLVLTNAHVVIEEKTGKPYPRLSVFLKPARVTGDAKTDLSQMARATVVSYSSSLDVALLKLEGVAGPLPTVALSDTDRTRIGDRVVAIGHPEQGGLWTLTTGVISAEIDHFNGVKGKDVYQTETGLNRGNSGGPLIDSEGRVIGINTAIARVAPDGLPLASINFSLKSTVATRWLREQGMMVAHEGSPSAHTRAATEVPQSQTPQPSQAPGPLPSQPSQPAVPSQPSVPAKPDSRVPPAQPYNLDDLVSDWRKAEADLEDMMSEMRGRIKGR